MDQLIALCNEGAHYPRDLPDRSYLEYILESYSQKLDEHQLRLFSSEQDSKVTFRDLDNEGQSPYVWFPMFCIN